MSLAKGLSILFSEKLEASPLKSETRQDVIQQSFRVQTTEIREEKK